MGWREAGNGKVISVPFFSACGKIDVVLILDESGSIGLDHWQNDIVPFAIHLAQKLPIHPDYARLGCIRFHTEAEIFFEINQAGLQDHAAVCPEHPDPLNSLRVAFVSCARK